MPTKKTFFICTVKGVVRRVLRLEHLIEGGAVGLQTLEFAHNEELSHLNPHIQGVFCRKFEIKACRQTRCLHLRTHALFAHENTGK
jgi:hypothetical protein